jgi:hypothetical protein
MKYNEEEKFIIDALEKDEIKLYDPSKDELRAIKDATNQLWDRELEADVKNGLLDSLANEALFDFNSGKCNEL